MTMVIMATAIPAIIIMPMLVTPIGDGMGIIIIPAAAPLFTINIDVPIAGTERSSAIGRSAARAGAANIAMTAIGVISIATDEMIGGTGEIATIVATGGDMMTGMIIVGGVIVISVTGVVMTGHATGGGMTVPAAVQRSTAKL